MVKFVLYMIIATTPLEMIAFKTIFTQMGLVMTTLVKMLTPFVDNTMSNVLMEKMFRSHMKWWDNWMCKELCP
jgi:hypothetical protein